MGVKYSRGGTLGAHCLSVYGESADLCPRRQDLLCEREQLQQQLSDQLMQLSALRARLERSRLAAGVASDPGQPSRARLTYLQTELDSASKLIKTKEKQVRGRGIIELGMTTILPLSSSIA